MVKCRKCGLRGHSIAQCLDPCLRIEMRCKGHQVAPTLMHEILSKTKAKEVITGHNNKGPCKSWGYIRFLTLEDRENAAVPIRDLIVRGVISPRVIKADRGPLNECWRCGAIDEDEKAAGRAPHKSHDLKCLSTLRIGTLK